MKLGEIMQFPQSLKFPNGQNWYSKLRQVDHRGRAAYYHPLLLSIRRHVEIGAIVL